MQTYATLHCAHPPDTHPLNLVNPIVDRMDK